ncbi:hypothetical protein JTB14_015032 [Gonioctena quinquepunctata]|nr:hypothetical protein JTB14_015032 [Gonioctena quinquepunctata]
MNAEAIINWRGGTFKKQWKDEAKEMKRLKMKHKRYIITTNDRIKIRKEKAAHQRKQAEVQRLRNTFNDRPTMRTSTEPIRRSSDPSNVTEYYQHDDVHDTPTLNSG